LLHLHFVGKAETDRDDRARQMKRWRLVEQLAPGTKVGFFSRSKNWQYYGMFGTRLQYVPQRIEADGRPYEDLHLHWRQTRPTWWNEPRTRAGDDYVEQLCRVGLDAMLLGKKSTQQWAARYRMLKRSPRAQLEAQNRDAALFSLRCRQ
jgi:hypothetical protein